MVAQLAANLAESRGPFLWPTARLKIGRAVSSFFIRKKTAPQNWNLRGCRVVIRAMARNYFLK